MIHTLNVRFFFRWQPPSSFMGRFGGGWNWALGFAAGSHALEINLLVCALVISWKCKKEK